MKEGVGASLEMTQMRNPICPNTRYDLEDPLLDPHFLPIVSANSSPFHT